MTPEPTVLIKHVRALIADEPVVREVSMFGGRSVMVNEKMVVSALKDGGLLVRVDAEQHDASWASQERYRRRWDRGATWDRDGSKSQPTRSVTTNNCRLGSASRWTTTGP